MYKITVTAEDVGKKYTFETSQPSGAERLDTYIRLFNASGTQLAYDDDGGTGAYACLDYTFSVAGTYYLGICECDTQDYNPNVETPGTSYVVQYALSITAMSTVSLLTVTGGSNSLVISWTAPLPVGSELQFKKVGDKWTTWEGNFAGTSTTIPGLVAGTYEVQLVDANGNNLFTESGVVVAASGKSAPTALKPKAKVEKQVATINSVTVSWAAKKATAESNARYVVSYSVKEGKIWTEEGKFSTSGNNHLFTGLKPGTSYRITITAVNANGEAGTNKKGKPTSVVTVTAKTLKYTAVKVSKPVKFTTEGSWKVAATITLPKKVPAGATYANYELYQDMGKKAPVQFVRVDETDFTVVSTTLTTTLTIDWSKLGLVDTAKNNFVLRAVTDGKESADAKITIKFSKLKA